MAQQTAVEWLIEQLEVFITFDEELTWNKLFEEAKQMEKEQIIDAFDIGTIDDNMIGNEYYNEKYGENKD